MAANLLDGQKPDSLAEFEQVQKKYKCTKSRRIFQHVVKGFDPACCTFEGAIAGCQRSGMIPVTITGTMFTLFQDRAFKGLQHLRRGHVLEKHEAEGFQPQYVEFKAYPKFGNWGEPGYPATLPGPVLLTRKYSGSMILVCFVGGFRVLRPAVPAQSCLVYSHAIGTAYCTSKNGFDNVYSQAAQRLLPKDFLETLSIKHGVHMLVCELMGLDEHAYVESPEVSLIVHGISLSKGDSIDEFRATDVGFANESSRRHTVSEIVELCPDQFPADIAWPDRVRPVEFTRFDTFEQALAHFQGENAAALPSNASEWATKGEGYVVLGSDGQRLKLKFWRYLMHREFRVIRQAKACPLVPDLLRRFKTMGCTLDMPGQLKWATLLRAWFLKHAGESGPFIAAKDAFLERFASEASTGGPADNQVLGDDDVDAQLLRLPLIIALQGVQCSGKTTLRQKLLPCLHWHGSQDEHGSVAALVQSLTAAFEAWHAALGGDNVSKAQHRFVAVVDRCNKSQLERDNLEAALNKHFPGLYVLEYVLVPGSGDAGTAPGPHSASEAGVGLPELVRRFAARTEDAGHMFSPYTVGMLRGMEILAQGWREYTPVGRPWSDDLLKAWHVQPVGVGLPDGQPLAPQHPTRNPKPGKVVYSGFGVLLDPAVYGYDTGAQVLRPGALWVGCQSQGACLPSPGKWHGTHVTHTFGPKDPLPEGVAVDITVTGHYERRTAEGLMNLCGLTVSYVWQDVPHMGHITLFCAPGVTPKESNDVLAAAMDGTDQGEALRGSPSAGAPQQLLPCTRAKLDTPYKLCGFSGTWKR